MKSFKIIKKLNMIILLIVVSLILIFGSCFEFYYKASKTSKNSIKQFLENNSKHSVIMLENKIDEIFATLEIYSNLVSKFNLLEEKEEVTTILERAVNFGQFLRFGVTLPSGRGYTSDNKYLNIEDREYFKQAMKGENVISEVIQTREDQKECIVFSVPIYEDNVKKTENIKGVMRCVIGTDVLEKLLDIRLLSGKEKFYIIQSDGRMVTRTRDEMVDVSDYFDFLNRKKLSTEEINQFSLALQERKQGYLVYKQENGLQYCYYSPVSNSDWFILTMIPEEVFSSLTKEYTSQGILLMFKILLIMSCFYIILIFQNSREKGKTQALNQKLEAVISNTPGGVLRCRADSEMKIDYISEECLELFKCTGDMIQTVYHNSFLNLIYKEDYKQILSSIQLTKNRPKEKEIEDVYRIITALGDVVWVNSRKQLMTDEHGDKWFYISLFDITESKLMQDKIFLKEKCFKALLEQSDSIIFDWNIKTDSIEFSGKWADKFREKLYKKNFLKELSDSEEKRKAKAFFESLVYHSPFGQMEDQIRDKEGNLIWCKITAKTIFDQNETPHNVIGIIEDINNIKKHTEILERKSTQDGLTGLLNKETTSTILKSIIAQSKEGDFHALFIIDIDDFKNINDSLGHLYGDLALQKIAATMKQTFRKEDIIGRIGGDEFVVFLKNINCEHHDFVSERASTLLDLIQTLNIGENETYQISCSMGVSIYPQNGTDYHILFEKADQALYTAKKNGKASFHFSLEEQ